MTTPSVPPSLSRLWQRARNPHVQDAVYLTVYGLLAFGGITVLLNPPSSIEGLIGAVLTLTWGGLFVFGGVCGAVAVPPGWWWLEKIGALAIFFAAAIYAATVIYLHFSSSGNRLMQFSVIACLGLLLGLRSWDIRGLDYDPRR